MTSWRERWSEKHLSFEEIPLVVERIKREGKTIVTINGSFDLLHVGHLEILYQAKQQGDYLFVALNSDLSVARYKGSSRPCVPLVQRLQLIAALGFVDYVTSFEEDTPFTFLQNVRPDVHVNGAEYGENCIEADLVRSFGGRIHLVSRIPNLSTTEMIVRAFRSFQLENADPFSEKESI